MELIFDRNIKYEKRLAVKLYNNIYFENNGLEKNHLYCIIVLSSETKPFYYNNIYFENNGSKTFRLYNFPLSFETKTILLEKISFLHEK